MDTYNLIVVLLFLGMIGVLVIVGLAKILGENAVPRMALGGAAILLPLVAADFGSRDAPTWIWLGTAVTGWICLGFYPASNRGGKWTLFAFYPIWFLIWTTLMDLSRHGLRLIGP